MVERQLQVKIEDVTDDRARGAKVQEVAIAQPTTLEPGPSPALSFLNRPRTIPRLSAYLVAAQCKTKRGRKVLDVEWARQARVGRVAVESPQEPEKL